MAIGRGERDCIAASRFLDFDVLERVDVGPPLFAARASHGLVSMPAIDLHKAALDLIAIAERTVDAAAFQVALLGFVG